MAKEKAATAEELNALAERRRQEQSAERQKREREKAQRAGLWSRRDFFSRLSWGGFGAFSLISLLAFVRSAFPRVLFVPPSTFKAGFPADYPVGEVSEKYKTEFRVWIVLDFALSGQVEEAADLIAKIDSVTLSDGERLVLAMAEPWRS